MAEIKTRLATKIACRVVGLDRDRFNEHVAAGNFPCAPETIPGRARYFDPDDMIGLWLFKEFLDEGVDAPVAGRMACEIMRCARQHPDAPTISLVYHYFPSFEAVPSTVVPEPSSWDEALLSGRDIRKVLTYRVSKLRQMIDHHTKVEINMHGDDD
ncbi:conserved hypothetical protein [Altererythrobacter sp. B11]|uniref:hypothetical protein n=1 Tax=Altererythrobacter sp. B11 TaxID=2060312 RepID=UPI000DC72368|nr:hypothetical protein [Altererythrobacter sp. B11]BBC74405.1 conserved hypothetical protein [Altererythrobacter sp. B11]